MNRNVQPAARPPKRSAGHVVGSVPPESRGTRPEQGKRNAKIATDRSGRYAAPSARVTAISRIGSLSGAPGGNPTENSSPDAAMERRNRRTRTPVPGRRGREEEGKRGRGETGPS